MSASIQQPEQHYWFNSLPRKLMFAIALWLAGALFFVGLTLNITWRLEDRGVAINEAGSLRKQSYLMVTLVQSGQSQELPNEIRSFNQKLENLSQLDTQMWLFENRSHISQLTTVRTEFQAFQLRLQDATAHPDTMNTLLASTRPFISQIDALVKSIEDENTHSIQVMRLAQVLLMLMAFVSALLSKFLLNRLVIYPLSELNEGLDEIKAGNLSKRLQLQTDDEFNQVSDGFNRMAESLQDAYQHLEDKVKQKTADLEQTNQQLSTLYQTTSYLHQTTVDNPTLDEFLRRILSLANAQSGSIRLLNEQGQQMEMVSSINLPEELLQHPDCLQSTACLCGDTLQHADFIIHIEPNNSPELLCQRLGIAHLMVYKIQLRNHTLGLLTLYHQHKTPEVEQESPLINLLCGQLAVAIENHRLIMREKQYAVLEERNIMAQGLHDSIAQSLSFINLQLQMLEQAIKKGNPEKVTKHLAFMDTGVQQCYDDVRELLANFRLKLAKESFQEVLASVVDRFKAQTTSDVSLRFQSTGADLTPQQQLQLVFIVQEALSNIRKHAKAKHVTVDFNNFDDIQLSIQDDGVGFDTRVDKEHQGHHIGLSIMQERIHQVDGLLNITSHPNQGTTIQVTIPHNRR